MECAEKPELDRLARLAVGAAMEVLNTLGAGFLEKVYERALVSELTARGLEVKPQAALEVVYKGEPVGHYTADLLIEDRLIVELKCVQALREEHIAQCLNYLAASRLKIALLLNFSTPRLEWRRVVRGL
ncbi:GxxExxY protein [Natronospira bacteriovora]|uniref:GxxExxY protein n=1 Tax=Natronospira bacteriovora TaxID=3069753 RepID=A0ABU0WAV8_9GAMM|nr:GxxExxY protein [Natronospira sp. AB-CW4]MDQ2070903.1 GxxExxY protein [Natronospira sp. AB-CW4]